MKLTRIELKNFRLLKDATLRFCGTPAVTILVGPNNSGKTSVAEALQLFTERSAREFNHGDFSLKSWKSFKATETVIEANAAKKEGESQDPLPDFPTISLSMHFDYDNTPEDFVVVDELLMDLDEAKSSVVVSVEFAVKDAAKLAATYLVEREVGQSLFDFVTERLSEHYALTCYKVDPATGERAPLADRSVLKKLIQIDFVAAQRHIDDQEKGAQATRLSRLLHSHYERRYKKVEPVNFKALENAIKRASGDLSSHYVEAFAGLIDGLSKFGYPQEKSPKLTIRAELQANTLFRDNTRIYYAAEDGELGPEGVFGTYDLPEKYNGLGFKNLIYMVLQLKSFRDEFEKEGETRPRVHLVFIEEAEVHLHPQVQSVFIKNISTFLKSAGVDHDTQLVLTTHSPHIVAGSGFAPIRYFRQRSASVVVRDLLEFESKVTAPDAADALKFLTRYMTLTRCDLFFADKAILIEGQVERLLLPQMVAEAATGPNAKLAAEYLSIIEVGGAYAHAFKSLIEFIGVPTLVITDLDSVGSDRKKCPVADGVSSSNATLKAWIPGTSELAELRAATTGDKVKGSTCVAYQVPEDDKLPCGRSFEEAFIYKNAEWLIANRTKLLATGPQFEKLDAAGLRTAAFGLTLGKVDFALDLVVNEGWKSPKYIADGLAWLAGQPV